MNEEVGRTLRKLIGLLGDEGFVVDPYDTANHLPKDAGCSWAAIGFRQPDNHRVRLTGQDPMGACVKSGIVVTQDHHFRGEYVVTKREKVDV